MRTGKDSTGTYRDKIKEVKAMHVCYEGTILLLFPSLQLLVLIVNINNNFSSEIIQSELDAEDIQQLEIW